MHQLSFNHIETPTLKRSNLLLDTGHFSHNTICNETARLELEQRYANIFEETEKFSRKTVSFQANKTAIVHNWFKYREGFSAELVDLLLSEFGTKAGDKVLDPFAGSCVTLLQSKFCGYDAVGIELLPHSHLIWDAKSRIFDYDLAELKDIQCLIKETTPPFTPNLTFPHLKITESAFPVNTENSIISYKNWFSNLDISKNAKILCTALLMNILEDVSYTRKDGQYLRWDARASKIIHRNTIRISQGKKPTRGINKGNLPSVRDALLNKLYDVIRDIEHLQHHTLSQQSNQRLIKGNTLFELPLLEANTFDAVITSPPYANRYDYTRTYALELAFLGVDQEIFKLRQDMLSCTVENKPKTNSLKQFYESISATTRYKNIMRFVESSPVLQEIDKALAIRNEREEINNRGIMRMVKQYFIELAVVYAEIYRVCKPGAQIAFINDNVRYAGEVIPVDTISTSLAESIGFIPKKIYVIPQRKGNSSQQMKKFGRRELRKSITIWQKPN